MGIAASHEGLLMQGRLSDQALGQLRVFFPLKKKEKNFVLLLPF